MGLVSRSSKAFDRVPRELLWAIMEKYGVPPKLACFLRPLHSNFKIRFTVDDVTQAMKCTIGVKQGDMCVFKSQK